MRPDLTYLRPVGDHDSRERTTLLGATNSWQRWERQYDADGELEFTLPDVLQIPPITRHGNVAEIAKYFGGFEQLGTAVNQLQSPLYAT